MSHQVSSYFYEQSQLKANSKLVRQFFIGNSDYSDFVLRWPTFKSEWNGVRSTKATLPCANENRTFNFIRDNVANINAECELRFGYSADYNWANVHSGSYAYVDSHQSNADLMSSSHTYELFLWVDSVRPTARVFTKTGGATLGGIYKSGNNLTFYAPYSSGVIVTGFNTPIECNTYIHYIGLVNVESLYRAGYINGVLVYSNAHTAGTAKFAAATSEYMISNSSNTFVGEIGLVRLYNMALTPTEILQTYSTGLSQQPPILHYNFFVGNNYISKLLDLIGSANATWTGSYSPTVGPLVDSYSFKSVVTHIPLLQGKLESIRYSKGEANLTMVDKFKQLQERVVGTSDVPVLFTGSSYLVSDLAWYLCTSYGGMDATTNSSNPDIDWESFAEWAAIFSGDNIFANAKFTGTKVVEGLRNIAEMTLSAVYQADNKIHFRRFTNVTSDSYALDQNNYISHESEINDSDVINRMLVMFNYDITSRYHAGTVTAANTASVNSFGLKESTEKNQSIWYINSASALNMAQRVLFTKGVPYEKLQVVTPMNTAPYKIGDTMYTSEPLLESFGDVYLALSKEVNMHNGTITFGMDASQILGGLFTLDISSLGGTAILS